MIQHSLIRLAFRKQLLTVAGIPTLKAFENVDFNPGIEQQYLEEDFVPATSDVTSFPASTGLLMGTGLYVVKWYCVQNTGSVPADQGVDAILAVFPAGLALSLSNGDTVKIPPKPAPSRSQLIPNGAGWAAIAVRIPYVVYSRNF